MLMRWSEKKKVFVEAYKLMLELTKEHFQVDVKKYEEMLLAELVNVKKHGKEKQWQNIYVTYWENGSAGSFKDLIYHSDRGRQYCSTWYTGILKRSPSQQTLLTHQQPMLIKKLINGLRKITGFYAFFPKSILSNAVYLALKLPVYAGNTCNRNHTKTNTDDRNNPRKFSLLLIGGYFFLLNREVFIFKASHWPDPPAYYAPLFPDEHVQIYLVPAFYRTNGINRWIFYQDKANRSDRYPRWIPF